MRLRAWEEPSILKPASFSSGLARSEIGVRALRLRNKILSLRGENERAGTGGASTISLISFGGMRYPPDDEASESMAEN